MAIKRGVSLYSYQQAQFLHEIDLEGKIREVTQNLDGADGIEVVDEMDLPYPNPDDDFLRRWYGWLDTYGATPVAMDVGMDVLQFRDHVMTHAECAERLKHDIRLAKRLGFSNVRVLSIVPLDVLQMALPVAEELDIRLGKEIHQPMALEGPEVTEILEVAERTGTRHLGIVPDLGIFGFKPSEVQLAFFQRRGAQASACDAAADLAVKLRSPEAPFSLVDMSTHTAGNLRSAFTRFLNTGDCAPDFVEPFRGVQHYADTHVENPTSYDYSVVAEALMLSNTSADTLRDIAGHVIHIHGKFNHMSEVPGRPGEYQDAAIDYPSVIAALKAGGFDGYINTEYEGQRYHQDQEREFLEDEIEQVRRHHEMLRRLLAA